MTGYEQMLQQFLAQFMFCVSYGCLYLQQNQNQQIWAMLYVISEYLPILEYQSKINFTVAWNRGFLFNAIFSITWINVQINIISKPPSIIDITSPHYNITISQYHAQNNIKTKQLGHNILTNKMFPVQSTNYQQRNRRRGRNDPNNRDYICPCGKSYLSYPALFTHIKTKHNGRAPGQIIKPTPQNSRRGRPKAREVYDSQSDTEDIASNALDRLCDYVVGIVPQKFEESPRLKQILMKDSFYEIYTSFNQQEQQPKYNEADDIYEQTCQNVLAQFIAEINKRLNQPFYIDILFLFVVMITRGIQKIKDDPDCLKEEPIQNIIYYANDLLLKILPEFRTKENLEGLGIFGQKEMASLLEYFYNWLTQKKYLNVKVKRNQKFFE